MQSIEILYWGLSILFCLAMCFAILLWCRSWRREEQEETARQVRALAEEVARLNAAVDLLAHTAAALQTADEQLSGHVETLQKNLRQLRPGAGQAKRAVPVRPVEPGPRKAAGPPAEERPSVSSEPVPGSEQDLYARARVLLGQGHSPMEVARILDIGAAEVKMLARVMGLDGAPKTGTRETERSG